MFKDKHTRVLPGSEIRLEPEERIYAPLPREKLSRVKGKKPNSLQDFFLTAPWDEYMSYWVYRAEDAHSKIKERALSPPWLAASDLEELTFQYNRIKGLANQYREAMKTRDVQTARAAAQLIARTMREYEGRATTSVVNAQALGGDKPQGFSRLVDMKNPEWTFVHKRYSAITQAANKSRREDAFRAITEWLKQTYQGRSEEKRVFWLHGEPGCGKSVIAHVFAKMCRKRKALAAGFIFANNPNEALVMDAFLATLTLDIGTFLGSDFEVALMRVIDSLGAAGKHFFEWDMTEQLEKLLIDTYRHLPENRRLPLLVILDGLDKITGPWKITEVMKVSIERGLPVHFFVTSSEENHVRGWMEQHLKGLFVEFELEKYRCDPTPTQATFGDIPPPPTQSLLEEAEGELTDAFRAIDLEQGQLVSEDDDARSIYYDAESDYNVL